MDYSSYHTPFHFNLHTMVFQPMEHYGNNFINQDVSICISNFLNQREKISMCTTAKDCHRTIQGRLPTKTQYVTTVRPNCFSACVEKNGIYTIPIDTFHKGEVSGDLNMHIYVYVGINEDEHFLLKWAYMYKEGMKKFDGIYTNSQISNFGLSLYEDDMDESTEGFMIERLGENQDKKLSDFVMYVPSNVLDAIVENTSIIEYRAYAPSYGNDYSDRVDIFKAFRERDTKLKNLVLAGEIRDDVFEIIVGGDFLDEITVLKICSQSCEYMMGTFSNQVHELFQRIGRCEKIESLSLSHVMMGSLEFLLNIDSLEKVHLESCTLECEESEEFGDFLFNCSAREFRINRFFMDKKEIEQFRNIFLNPNIVNLEMIQVPRCETMVDDIIDMIKEGTIEKLSIDRCDISAPSINYILQATLSSRSKLTHIGIIGNQTGGCIRFDNFTGTSLRYIHVGKDHACVTMSSLSCFFQDMVSNGTPCIIDTRTYSEYYHGVCTRNGEIFEEIYMGRDFGQEYGLGGM